MTPPAPPPAAASSAPLPLSDLRVLELSHAVMGPSAGMILADLGADVIKLEPPDGDRTRRLKGAGSGFFGMYGRNKRSIALDLKAPACRPALEALIRRADVLIENFAPGAMDRSGLGWEDASRLNPRLVYCALKGFLSGPYEERRALDEIAQMMSGLAWMTGPPGRPLRAGTSIIDILGGMSGVVAILAALREREKTGRGQLVKAGLFEAAAFTVGQHLVQHAVNGEPLQPMSVPVRAWGIYDIFRSAEERMIFVGVVTDTQWAKFCEVFARPDLRDDPRLAGNAERVAAREWLVPAVQEMLGALSTAEVLAKCEKAQLAFGPVNRPEDLLDDPHLNAGGGLGSTRLPGGIEARVPRLPIEMDGRGFGVRTDPPEVSGEAREILAEAGLDEAEIAALIESGAVRG